MPLPPYIRKGRASIQFGTMNKAIFGLENIVTVYLAAMLALSNELTIGMIFAFMAYKMSFTEKAATLVEKASGSCQEATISRAAPSSTMADHGSRPSSRSRLTIPPILATDALLMSGSKPPPKTT